MVGAAAIFLLCSHSVLTAVCSQTRCRGWAVVGNLEAGWQLKLWYSFLLLLLLDAWFLAMRLWLLPGESFSGPSLFWFVFAAGKEVVRAVLTCCTLHFQAAPKSYLSPLSHSC